MFDDDRWSDDLIGKCKIQLSEVFEGEGID